MFTKLINSIKSLVINLWDKVKLIHWGYGAFLACYATAMYSHVLKFVVGDLMGFVPLKSTFVEAVALYIVAVIVLGIMRKHDA